MSAIYQKGEVLGWGTVGAVYNGWDDLLDRHVALKELIQPFAGNEAFVRAFLAQAQKMLDLSHPNLLATYAVHTDRTQHAVVRELATETVGQRCLRVPMDPETLVTVVRHALLGLDAIHRRGLLHRSVKPENLFAFGSVFKIGDFGLAPVSGAPHLGSGQSRFTAPEVLLDAEQADRASDLYSLGFSAYQLLLGTNRLELAIEDMIAGSSPAGQRDIEEQDTDQVWSRFHLDRAELPPLHELSPGFPVAFSLVLHKMIRKERGHRFSTCGEALASLGSLEPPSALNLSSTLNIQLPKNTGGSASSRGAAAAITGGALLVAGLASWYLLSQRAQAAPERLREKGYPRASTDSPLKQEAENVSPSGDLAGKPRLELRLVTRAAGEPPRIPVDTSIKFEVVSNREGFLLIYAADSEGTVSCLYPNRNHSRVRLEPGRAVTIPFDEELKSGWLIASPPLGAERIFALSSDSELPPLPEGRTGEAWTTNYPWEGGGPQAPARRFTEWLAGLRRDGARKILETELKLEIVEKKLQ